MLLGPMLGRRRAGALPYEHTAPRERLRPAEDLAVEFHYRAEPSRQAHLDLERLPGAGRPRDLEALDSRQVAGPADLRVSPLEQQRRLRNGLGQKERRLPGDRKSTRLNSSHGSISYAVFCLKKKKK